MPFKVTNPPKVIPNQEKNDENRLKHLAALRDFCGLTNRTCWSHQSKWAFALKRLLCNVACSSVFTRLSLARVFRVLKKIESISLVMQALVLCKRSYLSRNSVTNI